MGEDKKGKAQKNKGVSTTNEPTKRNTYFSDTDSTEPSICPTKSITKVKHQLQTVIDLMGPDSPEFQPTTSNDGDNDADNEESVLSTVSVKFLKVSKTDEDATSFTENITDPTIPPDVTLHEDTDLSKIVGKNSSLLEFPDSEFPQYICPPPLLPANVAFNSECMCPQIASYIHQGAMSVPCVGGSKEARKCVKHRNIFCALFKSLKERRHEFVSGRKEYYSMNIKHSHDDQSPPRRLIFDLVGDISDHNCKCKVSEELKQTYFNENYSTVKTKESKNFNNEQLSKEDQRCEPIATPFPQESTVYIDNKGNKLHQKTTYSDHNGTTKVDVYYFDHGNSGYLKTTDSPPLVMTEALAEKTEAYTTKFWAEIFGTLHIGISFGTSFILQFFRFILYSLFRPLTIGLIQLGSDYFFKPCIATLFNAVIQPPLIFIYNVATSLRDVCDPVAEAVGYFLREIANVVRAFRLVETRREKCAENGCKYEKKVNERK